jgi:transposase-like protein
MDLFEIYSRFKTERDCHSYLIEMRWPDGIKCVYCSSKIVYRRSYGNGLKCGRCNKSFTVTAGTIFHASKLPLMKWLLAVSQILAAKKGISSLQLARTLHVNKNTAWYMQQRIRKCMKSDILLKGIVEADETYVGGSLGNMSKTKKEQKKPHKTGMAHKQAVLGMIERTSGAIVLRKLPHANGENIKPILKQTISTDSELVTDGFGAYSGMEKHFSNHIKMNHEKGKHRQGDYHLNNIEGFFTTIKRAIIGQYHKITDPHLQNYLDEIAFKKNTPSHLAFNALFIAACATY